MRKIEKKKTTKNSGAIAVRIVRWMNYHEWQFANGTRRFVGIAFSTATAARRTNEAPLGRRLLQSRGGY